MTSPYAPIPTYRDLMVVECHRECDRDAKPFCVVNHHAINAFTIVATFRFRQDADDVIDDFAKWDHEYSAGLPYTPTLPDSLNVNRCRTGGAK